MPVLMDPQAAQGSNCAPHAPDYELAHVVPMQILLDIPGGSILKGKGVGSGHPWEATAGPRLPQNSC